MILTNSLNLKHRFYYALGNKAGLNIFGTHDLQGVIKIWAENGTIRYSKACLLTNVCWIEPRQNDQIIGFHKKQPIYGDFVIAEVTEDGIQEASFNQVLCAINQISFVKPPTSIQLILE